MAGCVTTSGCSSHAISVYEGRSKTLMFSLSTPGGIPFDLAGVGVWFGVKEGVSSEESVVLKRNALAGGSDSEIAISDPASGVLRVYILPSDTVDRGGEKYVYDLVIRDSSGNVFEAVPPSEFSVSHTVTQI